MPRSRSLLLPSVLTVISAVVVVIAVFTPWYQTAIGPITAPDLVSGWDASSLAKLAVAAGCICALSALIVTMDHRGAAALHGPVRRIIAGIAFGSALVMAACVLFRLAVPPDPALGVTRQIGLIVASLASVIGVWAAGAQFSRTFPERRRQPRRRPRARGGAAPDASR